SAGIHVLFGLDAERGTGFDRGAQHVAGRDLRDAEPLRKRCRLGAFTGTGGAEQDQSHWVPILGKSWWSTDALIIGSGARAEQPGHGLEICRRIDSGLGRTLGHGDRDVRSMPQRAQLLERLQALDGRDLERSITLQESAAVTVDADVPVDGQSLGYH